MLWDSPAACRDPDAEVCLAYLTARDGTDDPVGLVGVCS
jgi:hypothetical protein